MPAGAFARNCAIYRRRRRKVSQWEDIVPEDAAEGDDSSNSSVDLSDGELSQSQSTSSETQSDNEGNSEEGGGLRSHRVSETAEDEQFSEQQERSLDDSASPALSIIEGNEESMDINETLST